MRFEELLFGVKIPVSDQEEVILDKFDKELFISSEDMDEFEYTLARKMASKGLLDIIERENDELFVLNVINYEKREDI